MKYDEWIMRHVEAAFLTVGGRRVSVHYTRSKEKPVALLVHGITGDFYGLVPLAAELATTHQVVIIELPGHGNSDEIEAMTGGMLRSWFKDTLVEIETVFKRPSFIAAHSFGCLSVLDEQVLSGYSVVLLNPVPTPSETYRRYAKSIMRSARFWAFVYNWPVLIVMRSMALVKLHYADARRRVRWVGWRSRPSYRQVVYQAGLVRIILATDGFAHCKDRLALIICGLYDTTAMERDSIDLVKVFGTAPTVFLRGGHLLPIEDPSRVAAAIRSVI